MNVFWNNGKNKTGPTSTLPHFKRPCFGVASQPVIRSLPVPSSTQQSNQSHSIAGNSVSSLRPSNLNHTTCMPSSSHSDGYQLNGLNDNNLAICRNQDVGGASQTLRRPISELPQRFRTIFEPFICFNSIQSMVFDTVFQTNVPIIVSAPTGSGKTGVFELTIIKMIQSIEQRMADVGPAKVVYLAPTKALCSERKNDWSKKFKPFNIECIELTSDVSAPVNYRNLNNTTILLATPEKWDSVTRNWKTHKAFIQSIRLLLVDEVHLINDGHRGATLEAVLSRMKIIRSVIWPSNEDSLRFIAVSATITNVEDIAEWLSTGQTKARIFRVEASERPVQLRTVVLGYQCSPNTNDYRFDALLNHKLAEVLKEYSNQKPSLIFCPTRKSAVTAAQTICRDGKFDSCYSNSKRAGYMEVSMHIKDKVLQETTRFGVAYHHAGLAQGDRRLIEDGFLTGKLMFLCCTSTLAVGVNLPAHLVVIKNTFYYDEGRFKSYPESSIIQMMGRAGRPQFDTHATAVIMTKNSCREEIEKMLTGKVIIDSHLHEHLTQHLNSEIVLGTVTNEMIARRWIDSTYLHVRLMKCPENYGLNAKSTKSEIESSIIKWCDQAIKLLIKHGMATKDKQDQLHPTDAGKAMAKHYVSLESTVKLISLTGDEDIWTLLQIIGSTSEVVNDIQLRTEDRPGLFKLNNPVDERLKLKNSFDKIDTREKKALVLIQAIFGNITISETTLYHESLRVIKNASRVCACLRDLCLVRDGVSYSLLRNALLLAQSFEARLWNDSIFVSRQIEKIGNSLSNNLAYNGLTSFESLRKANPRNIEIFCNRLPPFGSKVQQTCFGLPMYGIKIYFDEVINQPSRLQLFIELTILNGQDLRHNITLSNHQSTLIVGGLKSKKLLLKRAISDNHILNCPDLTICLGEEIDKSDIAVGDNIEAYVISDYYIGLNVSATLSCIP